MSTTISATTTQSASEFAALKDRLKTTWMTGDYGTFSRYMEEGAKEFYDRLKIQPGTRLLDVGTGAGQLALIAARAGATVTGSDIATNSLERARARARAEGLNITFEEADAEDLPYKDGAFDVVASLIGVMFAPRPERVAAEMIRVCKPGGRIIMANWTPGGFVGQMFKTIARHIAPSGMPAPVLWGDESTVRARFTTGIASITCTPRMYRFVYPFSPAEVVDFFREYYGPMTRAFASLNTTGQEHLREELIALWSRNNLATSGASTVLDGEYLEVIAVKAN